MERDIKNTYFLEFPAGFCDGPTGEVKYGTEIIELSYFGCYDGSYVVRVDSDHWGYGAAIIAFYVGGVYFHYTGPEYLVFRYDA